MTQAHYASIFVSATLFLFYGISCLTMEGMKHDFERFGLSHLRIPTGTLEVLGALGLIVGIEHMLNSETGSCEDLARRLLAALHGHAASDELAHDDVTFLLAEFVEGPPGPALWHVFKHRLLRQERR